MNILQAQKAKEPMPMGTPLISPRNCSTLPGILQKTRLRVLLQTACTCTTLKIPTWYTFSDSLQLNSRLFIFSRLRLHHGSRGKTSSFYHGLFAISSSSYTTSILGFIYISFCFLFLVLDSEKCCSVSYNNWLESRGKMSHVVPSFILMYM